MLRQARKWNHIKCSINPQQEKKNHDRQKYNQRRATNKK